MSYVIKQGKKSDFLSNYKKLTEIKNSIHSIINILTKIVKSSKI